MSLTNLQYVPKFGRLTNSYKPQDIIFFQWIWIWLRLLGSQEAVQNRRGIDLDLLGFGILCNMKRWNNVQSRADKSVSEHWSLSFSVPSSLFLFLREAAASPISSLSFMTILGLSRDGQSAGDPLYFRPSHNFSFNLDLIYVTNDMCSQECIRLRRSIYITWQKW